MDYPYGGVEVSSMPPFVFQGGICALTRDAVKAGKPVFLVAFDCQS